MAVEGEKITYLPTVLTVVPVGIRVKVRVEVMPVRVLVRIPVV